MRKLFTLLLAVAASVGTMFAWDYERVQIGDLYYNLDATNQTAEVTSQNSVYPYWSTTITTAIIPSSATYNSVTYSVTSIGDVAFMYCTGLTSVTIPNSVTSIGGSAFYGCSGLTSVTIPNSVTSIGGHAFRDCTGLTFVTIPNSVTSIGEYAFGGCTGLTSVTIPNSVTYIGDGAFYSCTSLPIIDNIRYADTYLVKVEDKTLSTYSIKEGTRFIGGGAFSNCTGLTSVEIPNSVTSIGSGAFAECTGLTSIEIPNSVTSIGSEAFRGCNGLTSLKLSAMIEPDRNSDYMLIAGMYRGGIRSYAPYNQQYYDWLKNLISIEAPAWFFDVPETDWIYCPRHLQHVAVNNGELTDNVLVVINRSYKTLQTLDVSNVTNTEFADEAFKGYYNLTELKLPAGLQKVSYMMVAGCINLQSIDIPASVEEIDQRAFEDCRSIKSITFGENPSLIRIGNWAFYNCHELQNLEIPEGVTEIGDGAFYGCTYLKNLNLPASVQSIGDNGFAFCSKLQKMVVHAVTPPDINYKTFEEVSRQTPVYVPDESVDEYENHPLWKEFFIQGISNMPTGIDEISSSLQGGDRGRIILHDGQIYILRGEKVYTLQGQEIK